MTELGIDLGASFNLASGATTSTSGIDASLRCLLGKSKARLGYLYTTIGGGVHEAPGALTKGGVYFSWDLAFYPPHTH